MELMVYFIVLLCIGFFAYRFGIRSFLFSIVYFLYSKTRVGYLFHLYQLSQARKKGLFHSKVKIHTHTGLKIIPLAIISDNYSYVIIDTVKNLAAVVDPSDPQTVQDVIVKENVRLDSILTTHKHWDHSGGNETLRSEFPGVKIYGSLLDNPPGVNRYIEEGDVIQIGSLSFSVINTPGHTVGHVVYVLDGSPFHAPNSLFSGDLLFIGGTGQMFEGTPLSMLTSLRKIMHLSETTLVWPGHEYSRRNLLFAANVEPHNKIIHAKLQSLIEAFKNKESSVPSSIAEERQINPFLRTHVPDVIHFTGVRNRPGEDCEEFSSRVLLTLRQEKNRF